ncbi:hypothetical protein LSAT2_002971 [Lamellibrachia satsuma]|nr:hypothetical protein LSAT2_002971 [Lamellibrachia satsuma]
MKVVLAVLVLVVLVSVTLAKPPKKPHGDGKPGMLGPNGIRISQISQHDVEKFKTMVITVTQNARTKMEDAANRATVAFGIERSKNLNSIGEDMMAIHDTVNHMLIRGRLMITSAFLVGFVGEERCKDISPEDIKRRSMPGRFSKEDRRVMCLISNVGELIQAFEEVSAYLELEATTSSRPAKCNQMLTYEATHGTVHDDDMLISFLSVDLYCLKGHMEFFLTFVDALVSEVDANDPDMVRMALLKGLIVAETLVEDAGETLSPFGDFMERNQNSVHDSTSPDIPFPSSAMPDTYLSGPATSDADISGPVDRKEFVRSSSDESSGSDSGESNSADSDVTVSDNDGPDPTSDPNTPLTVSTNMKKALNLIARLLKNRKAKK